MPYNLEEAVSRMRELVSEQVPFEHLGRDKNGIDCIGALAYAFQYDGELPVYNRDPFNGELEKHLTKVLGQPVLYRKSLLDPPVDIAQLQELDVLSMQYRGPSRHVALVVKHINIETALSVIHTDSNRKCVVEHILDSRWIRRIVGVWRP